MKFSILRKLAPVVALLLIVAACGDGDSGNETATSPTSTTAATTTTATATATPTDHDDVALFFDGAIVGEVSTVNCALSDGADSECYEITVAGYPADGEVGPFCPRTTSDTAESVGIWFDGNAVYDLDGEFILNLAELYGDDDWHMHDDEGNVLYTDTPEAFEAAARPDVDPEYQNHCVEGLIEWLDGGEAITTTVTIPVEPVPAEGVTAISGLVGVTLNGVMIAGPAPVDAILGAYTIAAFDDCGGHVNPFDGYHIHGATGCSETGTADDGETPVFAIALDGYPIHSPLAPDVEAAAGLDECNGHMTEDLGYHYHANQAEDNAVLSCLTGQVEASSAGGPGGPPPGG